MKTVLALIAGFVVTSSVYLLITTLLFKESFSDELPPAVASGLGSVAIMILLLNRKRMQLIPIRVKKH